MALIPGQFSPALVELAVQFGAELPFAVAARLLHRSCGVAISHDAIRRLTETAGAIRYQQEQELVAAITGAAQTPFADPVPLPEAAPIAPDVAVHLSLDGAMVSVLGGEWREVRTLVIGELQHTGAAKAQALSYLSAMVSSDAFGDLIVGELARRGVLTHPGPVVAVSDGALWIQEVLDLQLPASLRVLDLMHAVGYLAGAAKTAFGPGTVATSEWIATQRTALRTGKLDAVLAALDALPSSAAQTTARTYLHARRQMLDYPRCDAHGWPVGSGTVESANKLVVEARLKRSGMHWAREHVNPMLALRTLLANDRWDGGWSRIVTDWQHQHREDAARRRAARAVRDDVAAPPAPVKIEPVQPVETKPPRPKLVVNGKPTSDHPWKRCRAIPSSIVARSS